MSLFISGDPRLRLGVLRSDGVADIQFRAPWIEEHAIRFRLKPMFMSVDDLECRHYRTSRDDGQREAYQSQDSVSLASEQVGAQPIYRGP
ncbi:MAG: hypothetical protein INR64_09100 [Caulobacteraceae bacterium]|nr:hypothetical protein [Caulobacter sp.]